MQKKEDMKEHRGKKSSIPSPPYAVKPGAQPPLTLVEETTARLGFRPLVLNSDPQCWTPYSDLSMLDSP